MACSFLPVWQPFLYCRLTLPETCSHACRAVRAGEVNIILAALQTPVLVGHVEWERSPLSLFVRGTGRVLEVLSAGAAPLGSAQVPCLVTAAAASVAQVRLREGQVQVGNWALMAIVQRAVPAALVTLRKAVVEAPTLAGGVIRGSPPQCFQPLVLPFPILLSPAFVVPAAPMEVVGISGGGVALAGGGLRILIAGGWQRVALRLPKSHL